MYARCLLQHALDITQNLCSPGIEPATFQFTGLMTSWTPTRHIKRRNLDILIHCVVLTRSRVCEVRVYKYKHTVPWSWADTKIEEPFKIRFDVFIKILCSECNAKGL
jgi:hypothetical protein